MGIELPDSGFHFSVLTEFWARLIIGGTEHLLLDKMLERFKAHGLVKARSKQCTDSTHVLAAVHNLHLLELVAGTLRATLDDLAAIMSDWVHATAQPAASVASMANSATSSVPRRCHNQVVPASLRRPRFAKATRIALDIITATRTFLVLSFASLWRET